MSEFSELYQAEARAAESSDDEAERAARVHAAAVAAFDASFESSSGVDPKGSFSEPELASLGDFLEVVTRCEFRDAITGAVAGTARPLERREARRFEKKKRKAGRSQFDSGIDAEGRVLDASGVTQWDLVRGYDIGVLARPLGNGSVNEHCCVAVCEDGMLRVHEVLADADGCLFSVYGGFPTTSDVRVGEIHYETVHHGGGRHDIEEVPNLSEMSLGQMLAKIASEALDQ